MDLRSYFIFTSNYCNDLEFLGKLEYFIFYGEVMKELKEKELKEKELKEKELKEKELKEKELKEKELKEKEILKIDIDEEEYKKLSPLMTKLISDCKKITSSEYRYSYWNDINKLNLEEIKYYDTIFQSMNHKKYNYEEKKTEFTNTIKELLNKIEISLRAKKIMYVMIIFKILESDIGEVVIKNFPKLNFTINAKLNELYKDHNKEFVKYMKYNYVPYKKYISVFRNKRYILRKLKTILFSSYAFLKLYKNVQNKELEKRNNCVIS